MHNYKNKACPAKVFPDHKPFLSPFNIKRFKGHTKDQQNKTAEGDNLVHDIKGKMRKFNSL
jgi:hypothetical protein